MQSEHNGIYDATSGRLLYIQGDGVLTARNLELNSPRLTGDPVIFDGCQLERGDFYAAQLAGARFWDCDLAGADFSQAVLTGATLHGSRLDGVKHRREALRLRDAIKRNAVDELERVLERRAGRNGGC